MALTSRDMMKADRLALLLVALALLVVGIIWGVRSCNEAYQARNTEPIVIHDTVKVVSPRSSETAPDSAKTKHKRRKKKGEKTSKTRPAPHPHPRDYHSDNIPPIK